MNQANLVGNVGATPEIRTLDNGTMVAKFSLATNESYRDREGNLQTDTQWHNIICWGKLAGIAQQYFKAGTGLRITGKLKTRNWEDESNGVRHYRTEVHCSEFSFVGSGKKDSNDFPTEEPPGNYAPAKISQPEPTAEGSDDLPF